MGYLDKTGLAHFWEKIKAAKQNTLVGTTGQVVGFDAEGAAVAVEGWSNENLLLNWDFRNPVNRNGVLEYTNVGNPMDKWKYFRSTITIESDSIGMQWNKDTGGGLLFQYIPIEKIEPGQKYTFSVLVKDLGLISVTASALAVPPSSYTSLAYSPEADVRVEIAEGSLGGSYWMQCSIRTYTEDKYAILAAKAEKGSVQTLARQNDAGKWEIIDPSDYDLQYVLCSQYSPVTGEFVGSQHSNENLLDNAYWASKDTIINQRGQDEYTAAGYIIDRWRITEGMSLRLFDNGIILEHASSSFIRQTLENPATLSGKTVTLSALFSDVDVNSVNELLRCRINNTFTPYSTSVRSDGLCSITFTCPSDITSFHAEIGSSGSSSLVVHAVKLELGSVQTLAHQDADGNWILNDPPPNKALELAKCQRYQRVYCRTDAPTLPFIGFANSTGYQIVVNLLYDFAAKPANIASDTLVIRKVSTDEVIDNSNIASVTFYGQGRGYYTLVVIFKSAILTSGELYRIGAAQSANLIIDANL